MPEGTKKVTLMGAWEIRQRLGYSRGWVERLISRRDFPAPYQVLRMGSVWDSADVEAWIQEHRPEINEAPEDDPEAD
jgi:predicted DNA-binding transcriptional regulator AlpA